MTSPGVERIQARPLKLAFVVVGMAGVAVLVLSDYEKDEILLRGALFNILCSICYGMYAVALSKVAGTDNNFDYATFLGFVGLINSVFLIPIMIAMHVWGIQ